MRSDQSEDPKTGAIDDTDADEIRPGIEDPQETSPSAAAAAPAAEDAAGELATLRDRYLRLAAEYDNYRRRTDRERSESAARAQAQVVRQLLDPLDDLERVADFTAESTTVAALLEGVQMVERKMLRELEGAGLRVIDAAGRPFDPSIHEALSTVPTDSHEEDDSVADVFQKGYQFKDVLLRPARVRVKKYEG